MIQLLKYLNNFKFKTKPIFVFNLVKFLKKIVFIAILAIFFSQLI